jgi:hypothetical protein
MSNLKIITVATKSDYYFPYLKESIKRNGGELVVLGYGEEWQGFNWRFNLMINYLKTLNKKDIVCFLDGYDVICSRKLNELPNNFLRLKEKHYCKIIVGDDKINSLFIKYFSIFFLGGTCKNKFLNAGTYIGFAEDILYVITNIYQQTNSNSSDDQILMKTYCNKYPNEFYIDHKSELFLTINKPYQEIDEEINIKNGKLFYQDSRPFFIHGPGGTYLDNILQKLGYKNNGKVKEQLKSDFYKKYSLYLSPTIYDDIVKINPTNMILLSIVTILITYGVYHRTYFLKIITKKRKSKK